MQTRKKNFCSPSQNGHVGYYHHLVPKSLLVNFYILISFPETTWPIETKLVGIFIFLKEIYHRNKGSHTMVLVCGGANNVKFL